MSPGTSGQAELFGVVVVTKR